MAEKELKTRMGWVTCPRDKCAQLIDLHCNMPVTKCPYFIGKGDNIVHCKYDEDNLEVKS